MWRSLGVLIFLVFGAKASLKKDLDGFKKPLEDEVDITDFFYDGDDTLWAASLDYDELEIDRLREGTPDEEEEFLAIVGPRMNRLKQLQQKTQRVPSTEKPIKIKSAKIKTKKYKPELIKKGKKYNDPKYIKQLMAEKKIVEQKKIEKQEEVPEVKQTLDEVKKEITRSVNKLLLTGSNNPDAFIFENNERKPPVTVYFRGPFTSIVVNFQNKIWHYVVNPPSPFPRWFSEQHKDVIHEYQQTYVLIPKDVEKQFYDALLKILNMFLKIAT